jgi:cytochrome P450
MIAGRDTTSILLMWTFYCLTMNPQVLEKAREEIEKFSDPSSDIPTEEELKPMKYIDNILYEVLRLFPPVPTTGYII